MERRDRYKGLFDAGIGIEGINKTLEMEMTKKKR